MASCDAVLLWTWIWQLPIFCKKWVHWRPEASLMLSRHHQCCPLHRKRGCPSDIWWWWALKDTWDLLPIPDPKKGILELLFPLWTTWPPSMVQHTYGTRKALKKMFHSWNITTLVPYIPGQPQGQRGSWCAEVVPVPSSTKSSHINQSWWRFFFSSELFSMALITLSGPHLLCSLPLSRHCFGFGDHQDALVNVCGPFSW